MKQTFFIIFLIMPLLSVNAFTNTPPECVIAFAKGPFNKDSRITSMMGVHIQLQGKEHKGFLNWLVVKAEGVKKVEIILMDKRDQRITRQLSEEESIELDKWFATKKGNHGSYYFTPSDYAFFRKFILSWGGLDADKEWHQASRDFGIPQIIWVVTCRHETPVPRRGSHLIGSTTYFDSQGDKLCTFQELEYLD